MDELIVQLIEAFVRWLMGEKPKTSAPPRPTGVAPPPTAARPAVQRSMPRPMLKSPSSRRRAPVTVAVAEPILTLSLADDDRPAAPRVQPPAKTASPIARPATPPATRPDVRRWLTPTALRQQVVLSEILGKPVALRDE